MEPIFLCFSSTSNILGTLLTLANGATDSGLVCVTVSALVSCIQKSISAQVALSDGPVWARKKKLLSVRLARCLLLPAQIIINLEITQLCQRRHLNYRTVCQQHLYAVLGFWAKCEGPAVGKQAVFYKQSLFYLETSLMVV